MNAAELAVHAPMAWLGPGRIVRGAAVVCDGGAVGYAGDSVNAPEAEEKIELDGFLMPAAADRHVHIALVEAGAVVAGGVTAVRDLGWPADEIFPLADASEGPSFNGPLIRAAGPMLCGRGGTPAAARWMPPETTVQVGTPEEGAAAVSRLADRGAAQIKVVLEPEVTLDDATLATICQTASEHALPVTAHAEGEGELERALGAGVSELAHCPSSERLADPLVETMAKAVRIVSTLDVLSYGQDTPEIRTALDNLRRFCAAGGRVFYGTDLGRGHVSPGIDVRELLLLQEAGLTVEHVLEALARSPLEPGAPADILGLEESPFEMLGTFDRPALVVRAGRVVHPSE